MVAIGRAMMSEPQPTPAAGRADGGPVAACMLEKIFDLLLDIRKTGLTILMVERETPSGAAYGRMAPCWWAGDFASGTGAPNC